MATEVESPTDSHQYRIFLGSGSIPMDLHVELSEKDYLAYEQLHLRMENDPVFGNLYNYLLRNLHLVFRGLVRRLST